jgi:hypothetical protein
MGKLLNFTARYSTLFRMKETKKPSQLNRASFLGFWMGILYFFSASLLSAQGLQSKLVANVFATLADGQPGVVRITGTVANETTQTLSKIKIEDAKSAKSYFDIEKLDTGEEKEVTFDVAESALGISGDGSFLIPLRIVFEDDTHTKISQPVLATYSKKTENNRTSPILLGVDPEIQRTGTLDVSGETRLNVILQNQTANKVETRLELLTAKELSSNLDQNTITLEPNQEVTLPIKIVNSSAAIGSSYPLFIYSVVSSEGQTFSDSINLVANVMSYQTSPWMTPLVVFVLLLAAILGFYFYRQEKNVKIAEVGDAIASRQNNDEPELPGSNSSS